MPTRQTLRAHLHRREIDRLRVRAISRKRFAAKRLRERLMGNAERATCGLAFLTADAAAKPLWGRDRGQIHSGSPSDWVCAVSW
jgi:hypothetical protein